MNDFRRNGVQAASVNGSYSTRGNVILRVPQGSVHGLALFLLYIYDIEDKIQSNTSLYADDTIVFREINSIDDHSILQEDLDTLSGCTTTWLMEQIFANVSSFRLPKNVQEPSSNIPFWEKFLNVQIIMSILELQFQFTEICRSCSHYNSYKFSLCACSIILLNQPSFPADFPVSPASFQAITIPSIVWMKLPIDSRMMLLISTVLGAPLF